MSEPRPGSSEPFQREEAVYSQSIHEQDWDAFANLIEPLRAKLERCIGLYIGDLDEANNIVQETFARAGRDRAKLHNGSPVYPWLRAIGINLAKQFLDRRTRQAKPMDLRMEVSARAIRPAQRGVLSEIIQDELATKLWLAIGQLPAAYREAVVLHYLDGMDYAQIAELTGVGEGALRARAMRGRNLLRGSLGSVVDTWMR
jgi:RNA polymerase sigma-70 factor (ECF subfamily)